MSDHKHTPSPWWVENENEGDPQEYGPLWCVKGGTLDEDGPYMEAVLHFGVREDAVLMAAAPALRDALRKMLRAEYLKLPPPGRSEACDEAVSALKLSGWTGEL